MAADNYRFVREEGNEALVVKNGKTLCLIPITQVPFGIKEDDVFELQTTRTFE